MDLVNRPLSQEGNKYEVFLNFSRGEDTQESFSSCLYTSLRKDGISILKDDTSIELLRSIIGGSEISIIIFSKHYASSRKCLEELTKIMEFRRAYDHVIFPIFYGVVRSELCDQTSSFGEAFRCLVQRISPSEDEVTRWRTSLLEARDIYGFDVPDHIHSNNESEYIQNIVKSVHYILNVKSSSLSTYGLVGVSSQVQEVIAMLHNHKSKDVVSIGIRGTGGIGKTTLVRLIFDHIRYDFESAYFLPNDDREAWERERTWKRKVLVVVDDVDSLDQLHTLWGSTLWGSQEWFGEGSRIIIIIRDLHVYKTNQVYLLCHQMKLLSADASLELLSREAFKQESPKEEFVDISRRMVRYARGLPLAIKVLGSYMNGRSLMELESASRKLDSPYSHEYENLFNVLRLSYDSLDDHEKEILVSIGGIYLGEDLNVVLQKLDRSGCNVSNGIRVLMDRNFVTIDKNNKLRIHDGMHRMGRHIIRESSQNKLQNRGHRYEVFLSFRGETRATFTSHLYSALCNAGIVVFKDDVELPRGNFIKTELLQAIGSSKIAILIFSKEYAGSRWCLEELSLIMQYHKSNNQVVLPVFYDVDPSEIRNQSSSFGGGFEDLIHRISPPEYLVSKWRRNLRKAGGMAGIVVLGSRDEGEHVKDIVENVCDILDKKYLFVAEHPVGVNNRVQEVITMLQNHQYGDVIMVGIGGMGGIGKTTIAKAMYNEIGHTFDSRCYLSKIREAWDQEKDQVSLQNQLLSEICKTTKMKINNIESGKVTLRDRLHHKKALVVLDEVDELAQLKALVGSRDWFKSGSIIIITTRNQHLLRQMDCDVYLMKNLDQGESIELFSWHAFKQGSPKDDFIELSRDIVAYSGGLPLALEVLGSYLFAREVEEWKSVLEKLKKIPNDKIQKKLKISFDGLDDLEKEIFLDISCFFIGMDINEVVQILNGCGLFADIGIKTLVELSLVTIDEKNMLSMHDLLRDMGREIIRKKSPNELGKRSRLWSHEDALAVLLKGTGTKSIEGLSLKLSQSGKMHFQTEVFKKMKSLRLLRLDNVQLRGDYGYISKDVRWLCWHGFPGQYIPRNFYQQELVAIDLKYSSLRQLWKEPQLLEKLKILNLCHSPDLVQTPDFSKLPNLEKLMLNNCPSVSMIHHSIGLLDKLLLLNLEDCVGLCSLPRSIYKLKCLKTLILDGCKNIEKLEEDIEQMESLTTLSAPTIKQVPFSLVRLKSILYLSVCGYEGLSCHVIPSLCRSWMSPTNSPLPLIPTHAGMPSSILWDMLHKTCDPSTIISSSESKQQSLLLQDGLEIPDSLCTTNCKDIPGIENCSAHLLIQIGKNSTIFHTLSEQISQGLNLTKYSDDCVFLGDNYPYWLTFKGEGASVKFEVPLVIGHAHLKGMAICCIYFPSSDLGNKACESCISCLMIINYTKKTTLVYTGYKLNSLEEQEGKEILSNLGSNDEVEVKVVFGNIYTVKKTAVYLIYKESFDKHMEPSTCEATNLTVTKHKCDDEEEEH